MRGFACALIVLAGALVGGLALAATVEASAAPGEHASCMGIEASDISPPGSSEEAPAGMRDLLAFVDSLGQKNRGVVVSSLAALHEGSHAACDAAVE